MLEFENRHRGRILSDLNTGQRAFSDNIHAIITIAGCYPLTEDDDSELARLLPGVKRLQSDKVNLYRQQPRKPIARPSKSREPVVEDRVSGLSGSPGDSHFNAGLQSKLQRKLRQGSIRPEASIDLHGCRQTEAVRLLEQFFEDARRHRYRMLLVIHGKGYRSESEAVLKPLVHRWLANKSQVLAWCPAQARDGGAGASYVYLKID